MSLQIFAYIEHHNGVIDDTALELINAAKQIDADAKVTAIVCGSGDNLNAVLDTVAKTYPEVWKVDNPDVAYPNAEIIRSLLVNILPKDSLCLVPHDTLGMDLAPGLSVKLDAAHLADVIEFQGVEGNELKAIRQEYSGQVHAHMSCDLSKGAVITVRPGNFQPDESQSENGEIIDKSSEASQVESKRKFLEIVEAEVGEVDITKEDVLISIGRGVEDEENIEIVEELAEVMGGVVSCSRPVVDAKWMEKSRQVGTSGKTVKPKVYMAMGISGSFQHMGGVKGNPFIVAINKNPKAPIFQVADVGIVEDLLEFAPVLADKVKEMK
jgi:electron transfer flavoprotein alpha subunit